MSCIYSGYDQYEYFMASGYKDITDVETSPVSFLKKMEFQKLSELTVVSELLAGST